jgi:hypothetical protein
MKCKPDYKFLIVKTADNKYIELRTKSGEFIQSICCRECLPELKKVIKKYELEG